MLRSIQDRSEGAVAQIELRALELEDSARLLEETVRAHSAGRVLAAGRAGDLAALQRESGGNPFYLWHSPTATADRPAGPRTAMPWASRCRRR